MTFVRRAILLMLFLASPIGAAFLEASQPPAQPRQQDEFVPVDQLPPQDQLPSAPLLIGAYVFVVLALFGYVFSVGKRLTSVQREVERLQADIARRGQG